MRYLFCLVILFWTSTAVAQDPPAIPAGEDVIVAVKQGTPAPFTGQLFNNPTAVRWGIWLQQYRERSQVEQERAKAMCNVELDYKDRVSTIEAEKASALQQDLVARLQRSEGARMTAERRLSDPPWYKTGTFQFTLGVLTTVAVTIVVNKAF